ncbi:hypothetical protein RQP46_002662 [Phenoliferia psychrophenolica]
MSSPDPPKPSPAPAAPAPTPAAAASKKPATSTDTSRSNSRTRAPPKSPDPSADKKSAGTGRGGKAGGGARGGRRGSSGNHASVVKKDGSGGKTPPTGATTASAEGLAAGVKAKFSDAAAAPAPVANSSTSQQQHNPASPSSRTNKPSLAHRKNASGGQGQQPSPAQLNTSPQQPSTLNPNAGGFHPGSLGSISDMMDEGLITPTASSFDLMTGLPRSFNGTGGFRGAPSWGGATGGGLAPSADHLPEDVPGFGGVAGGNARAFAFPPPNPALQQQQQAMQMLQQQHAQQQQFQMYQLAQLQGFNPAAAMSTGGGNAAELIAEQLAIQQQLENLRLQQESLLARFGDMQAQTTSPNLGQQEPLSPRSSMHNASQSLGGNQAGHRRIQSHQQSGMMGSFGQGMGSFGGSSTGNPFSGAQGPPTSNLPKGHGRRHSVNVVNKSANGQPQPQQSQGLGNAFQFPNVGSGQTRQDQQLGEAEFAASGGGSNFRHSHHRTQSGSISSLGGWSLNNNNNQMHSLSGQANLAEAQSHLQQLAAYRASAGHSRLPSFGMSNMPGAGGPGPGQLSMANYGGGLPQQGGGQQVRKSLFAPYLPQASIPPLLAAGKLVIGVLRVNKRNRSDAYVATDVLDADIYICGSKDRNRALEGDIVAIELLDVDEVWGTKKEKEEKKRKKEESASYDPRATRDIRKSDKKKDDIEVEGQAPGLFEDEEVNDEQKPQFAGHVVAVVERAPGQLFSGMLGVLRPSSAATQQKQDAERREREGVDLRGHSQPQQAPRIIWFRPTDKRVPLIAIPTEQAPSDFIDRPDKYADRLFVACIKRWPITSLHPFGTLVEELGPIGDIETETSALLKDCNFSAEEFSESVVKCLPPTPWTIPEREASEQVRRDFRDHRVFTIDPATARDLDDALHVVKNDDGTFEVGVHIADVTHFVKPNTALDREARKRATTVYLVQRAVPMLPQVLSEELCSLTPGVDKLTFSVVFTMTPDGKIISTWFGKTIINSAGKLAYGDAQAVLDGNSLPSGKLNGDHKPEEVESDIKMLGDLAKHLRKRRFDNGALRIDNVKVFFNLDAEGQPADCNVDMRKEANELIEEFMLLANISVAGKIAAGLPDQALLRRHEPPIERRLESFVERMKSLKVDLDGSSSGSLMRTINNVTDESARLTLQHLSTKSMNRAKYFCSGMLDISKYHHYALNLPLYTHFTSPIRRYADILVHRQLEAILLNTSDAKFTLDTEAVSKIAQTCNTKKEAARLAQEQSAHLFLCVLINDLTQRYGPVVRPATVIGVLDEAYDVLVTELGIEKRVHCDNIPIDNHVYDEHTNSLQLYWKKGVETLRWLADTNKDEHLLRIRNQTEHHAKMMQSTSQSAQAESALFDDEDEDEDAPAPDAAKTSSQHAKSLAKAPLTFEEVERTGGHCIQTIRELQTTYVIITADLTKSPPVLKVLACNPFAGDR